MPAPEYHVQPIPRSLMAAFVAAHHYAVRVPLWGTVYRPHGPAAGGWRVNGRSGLQSFLDGFLEHRQMGLDHVPDAFQVHAYVVVDQEVPEPCDVAPWDLGVYA